MTRRSICATLCTIEGWSITTIYLNGTRVAHRLSLMEQPARVAQSVGNEDVCDRSMGARANSDEFHRLSNNMAAFWMGLGVSSIIVALNNVISGFRLVCGPHCRGEATRDTGGVG